MKTTKLLATVGSGVAIMAGAMMMAATPAISDDKPAIEVITCWCRWRYRRECQNDDDSHTSRPKAGHGCCE